MKHKPYGGFNIGDAVKAINGQPFDLLGDGVVIELNKGRVKVRFNALNNFGVDTAVTFMPNQLEKV